MILAFQQVRSPANCQVFTAEKLVAERTWDSAENRDLLDHIIQTLAQAQAAPRELTGIFVINGPGNFTPVRLSCLIANTLAHELKIPLYSLQSPEIADNDLRKAFFETKPAPQAQVEAVFGAEPRIGC